MGNATREALVALNEEVKALCKTGRHLTTYWLVKGVLVQGSTCLMFLIILLSCCKAIKAIMFNATKEAYTDNLLSLQELPFPPIMDDNMQ